MIRVCIDIRHLKSKPSGVGRYIKNLTEELLTHYEKECSFFLLGTRESFSLIEKDSGLYTAVLSPDPEAHPWSDIWFNTCLKKILRTLKISLFHSTAFKSFLWKPCCPVVTTIPDRVARFYPHTVPLKFRYYLNYNVKRAVKTSARIITISEQVKEELQTEFPSAPPVHVVYLGTRQDSLAEGNSSPSPIEGPYILVVGNIEPRKGILEMIQTYEACRNQFPQNNPKLVLCGQKLWNFNAPYQLAEQSPFSKDILFTGYVTDQELDSWYRHSSLTVIPSLYEGFGLPVLEAMRAKAPILIHQAKALSEIGQNLVRTTDIRNPESSAQILHQLLSKEEQSRNRIPEYQKHREKFTWLNCAKETFNIYLKTLSL